MNKALKVAYQTPGIQRVVNQLTIGNQTPAQPVQRPQPQPQLEPRGPETAMSQPNNPLRKGENESSPSPKPSLTERFQSVFSPNSSAKSAATDATARAERVPSSFSARPAATVSAEEVLAEPKPAPAQKARPLATPNGSEQVVGQPVRGPMPMATNGAPLPMYSPMSPAGTSPMRYDQPHLPNYAWPSYAAYPNYAAVTYPKQYSPTVWPYIGPFYPYPQVPLGWRKVSLEWSDGWWFLDFKDLPASCWQR